jgi:alkylation response protein AidB-like acyl-CoA dehydrogenase
MKEGVMPQLPETVRAVRDLVGDFVSRTVQPLADELERTGRIPQEILDRGAEIGLFGLGIPEEYGGSGNDPMTTVVALEALCEGPNAVSMVLGPSAPSAAIAMAGTEDQRQHYLPRLARGEIIASFALTEPEAGSDAAAIRTRAVRDGDSWVLSGEKIYIGRAAVAGVFLVSAVTDPGQGADGITVFLVDAGQGVRVGRADQHLGLHGSAGASVHFDNAVVPDSAVLGSVGKGFSVLKLTLHRARLWAGARSLGAATAALNLAVEHVRRREQFGKPLLDFQAVKVRLADMATELAAARMLVYHAAEVITDGKDAGQEVSIAKLYATEAAGRIVDQALQLHGGMGVSAEYPLERFYRDVRAYRILDGASDIQRLVIASGLRRNGVGRGLVPGAAS